MKRSDFHYELPPELIADRPPPERGDSRLLCLDGPTAELRHGHFRDLPDMLQAGDLLVFNDTRVIPARLYGRKTTGGQVEILVERILGPGRVLAHLRAGKSPRAGTAIRLLLRDGGFSGRQATVLGRQEDLFELGFDCEDVLGLLDQLGHVPLPPYIERPDEELDVARYQTVYAKEPGAVAAPTAGLHFDEAMLSRLRGMGVLFAYVTLHVGAGTFQPVRAEQVEEHVMHREYARVDARTCRLVKAAMAGGKRVIAVGTTSVRCLESACDGQQLRPFAGDTDIFIYPGYRFRCVDALLTNFHLPESTLIMLVSALAGREAVLAAYHEAVAQRYRFFSYGDAMWVTGREPSLLRQRLEGAG